MSSIDVNTATQWQPAVALDMGKANPFKFNDAIEAFRNWSNEQPLVEPHGLNDGWHVITPQLAENLLRRNIPGSNRKASFATVQYYARQMIAGEWKKTGEPIILSDQGNLLDAQHRLWAGYLSGVSFETYVVTNVLQFDNVFAYIDNGKTRSATDALHTAGVNGMSGVIASAVRLARFYDADAFSVMKKKHVSRPTPIEILVYAKAHPLMAQAAHVQIGEYKAATRLIGYSDIAVFVAWKILEGFGEDTLDHFMSDLGSDEPLSDGNPILLLRKKLKDDLASVEPMPKHHALAYVTKTFNAWRLREPMKRLFLKTEEPWPRFADTAAVDGEAAA